MPVLNAFEQLLAEGYFESRVGAGTFVASSLPDQRPSSDDKPANREPPAGSTRRPVSRRSEAILRAEPEPWLQGWGAFRVSQPAVDRFPLQVWSSLVARHSRNPRASLLHYGGPMGYGPFREAVAAYLRTARAVRCEAEQIMVVSGSQQALEISARVLLDPGSPGLDRRARLPWRAGCPDSRRRPARSGSRRRRGAGRGRRHGSRFPAAAARPPMSRRRINTLSERR